MKLSKYSIPLNQFPLRIQYTQWPYETWQVRLPGYIKSDTEFIVLEFNIIMPKYTVNRKLNNAMD